MSALGDKLRCPHCLEELDQLEDPKQLPCSHVFCSPCLETLTKAEEGKVEITCSICSKSHQVDNLAALPTPIDNTCASEQDTDGTINTVTPDNSEAKVKQEKGCDVCKEETTAVCYCIECDKSLCPRHEQLHQDFFGEDDAEKHKLLAIQTYLLKPNFYMKPNCYLHNKEYVVSCNKCFCLKCKDCAEDGKCKENNDHIYKTVQVIRSQLEMEFAELTKAVSLRMTELCRMEKETWQKLDNLEVECDKLRQDIQDKTQEMIETINEQQDKFLARIEIYVAEKKNQVEIELLELRTQREDMETLRCESELMIKNNHVTKIIEQREDTVSRLKEAADASAKMWDQVDLLILKESLRIFSFRSMKLVPSGAEFISSEHTGGRCYSTWFRENGQLLVGCHDGLHEYNLYGRGPTQLAEIPHVTSVAGWKSKYFGGDNLCMIAERRGIMTVYKWITSYRALSSGRRNPTRLFSFDSTKNARRLSTSKKYAVATAALNSIIIFDISRETKVSSELEFGVHSLSFLTDDCLIITSPDNCTMRMYHIENIDKLHLVWECSGLEGVSGVCTTQSGLIVCVSMKKKVIYIVSAQGILLNTLHHDQIQPCLGDISMHGDILAIACQEQNMFQLFRLK